jgi:very-short-patch-repair endonuclease
MNNFIFSESSCMNINENFICDLYHSGLSTIQIGNQVGIPAYVTRRILLRNGIKLRSRREALLLRFSNQTDEERKTEKRKVSGFTRRIALPTETICKLYQDGTSEKALSQKFNTQRSCIRRCLTESGISPRGRSEAMFVRMSQTSAEERNRLASAAHAATKGRKTGIAERERRAVTREQSQGRSDPTAMLLKEWLLKRGITSICEKSAGIYNIDLAVERTIAVELHGGGWHLCGQHRKREPIRIKYLLDSGWSVLTIWVDKPYHPLREVVADYIIAMLQELRSKPSTRRQNRVIWGDGKDLSSRRLDIDDVPVVLSPHCSQS